VRVVTDFGAFLLAIQRLDGRIAIQNPRFAQHGRIDVLQTGLQPTHAGLLVQLRKPSSHRILADHFCHAQQFRIDTVAAQGIDMGVALMPGQYRQQYRAQHVALVRRVGAGPAQRALRDPVVKQATDMQKFDEERQLAQRRHRRIRIPIDVDSPTKGIHRYWPANRHQRAGW
jgi:hypothetical protein